MLLNKIITNLSIKDNNQCNSLNIFLLQNLGNISHVKIYKQNIVDNEFIDDNQIKIIEKYYIKAKKYNDILKRLLHSWRCKKTVEYDFKNDLYLTPLSEFQDKHKIMLIENNTKYFFRLSDLVNSWMTSLKNSEGLFPKPLELKNPHTNLAFSINNLYNIYFKLLDTSFNIPYLLNCFFLCDMEVCRFSVKFLTILKEITIQNFSKSDNYHEKWEQILNMLHKYRTEIDYVTFSNFVDTADKISIVRKLNTILFYYLKSEFSCNPLLKEDCNIKAKQLIKDYIERNPYFGYDENSDVIIRYVPYNERRRRAISMPPPPPPQVLEDIRSRRRRRPTSPPPPPPPTNNLNNEETTEVNFIDSLASSRRRRYRNRSRTIRFPRVNPLFRPRLIRDTNESSSEEDNNDENETVTVINPFELNLDTTERLLHDIITTATSVIDESTMEPDAESFSDNELSSSGSVLLPPVHETDETPDHIVEPAEEPEDLPDPENTPDTPSQSELEPLIQNNNRQLDDIENQINNIQESLNELENEIISDNRQPSFHSRRHFTLLTTHRTAYGTRRRSAMFNPFVPRNELPRSPANRRTN